MSITVELLEERLSATLQIIAALILTDEEGLEICKEVDDAHPDPDWIASMRADLLSDEWRVPLVAAIRRLGFLANTHPGYVLTPLANGPADPRDLEAASQDLREALAVFARGEGDEIDDAFQWGKSYLIGRGHAEDVAIHLMNREGVILTCHAGMDRLRARRK